MLKKPKTCTECGKRINASNPSYAGGGSLDYDGKWERWAVCAKCRPPITVEEMQKYMTEVFRLSNK